MQNFWWRAGQEIPIPPVGLIMGTTSVVPTNWTTVDTVGSRFLKGTSQDPNSSATDAAGKTGARSGLSASSGSGGGHSSGNQLRVWKRGYNLLYTNNQRNPSRDKENAGTHSGHSVTAAYRPGSCDLKLIEALENAEFAESLIGFSTENLPDQTAYNSFNDTVGTRGLRSHTATIITESGKAVNTSGSVNNSHNHEVNVTSNSWVEIDQTPYESVSAGGGAHTHRSNSISVTNYTPKTVLMRAWQLANVKKMDGVIGMWTGMGIPEQWELVIEAIGRYVIFNASGVGQITGDNTLDFSGTLSTTGSGHSHVFNNIMSNGQRETAPIPHSSTHYHTHTYSRTNYGYEPERFYIKFIRYTG